MNTNVMKRRRSCEEQHDYAKQTYERNLSDEQNEMLLKNYEKSDEIDIEA